MQQRHILCHWPRFGGKKGSVFGREEVPGRLCANDRRGEGGREKGSSRERVDDLEVVPTNRGTLQKRDRIMNILKSHKALSAGFHSRGFSSVVHREQRQPSPVLSLSSFLVDSPPPPPSPPPAPISSPRFFSIPFPAPFPVALFLFSAAHGPAYSSAFLRPLLLAALGSRCAALCCSCCQPADQSMRDFCVGTTD